MRKLLYVPIIHTESDLGSAAPELNRRSASLIGESRWARHKATVAAFWQRVADCFAATEAANLRIYQDGLSVGGELAPRIVAEAAKRGSPNYEIILDLLQRGAEIRPTEDPALLKAEYEHLYRLAQAESSAQIMPAYLKYRSRQDRLLEQRDRFVARTINETLAEGEVGVLFMGAYHDPLSHLAADIVVEQLKDRVKVKAYFEQLVDGRHNEELEKLAGYLASPVASPRSRDKTTGH